jgi:AraC-like DNA-binding protein
MPWEVWLRTPRATLRESVIGLWAGVAAAAMERHRALPNGEIALMVHLNAPQRLTERDGSASDAMLRDGFLAGLQERPSTFVCIAPATRVVAARLSPLGAWRILGGAPQAELSHRVLELGDVLGAASGMHELRERMMEARDLGAALSWMERWLMRRAAAAPKPHAAVAQAVSLLARDDATQSLGTVARACGVSPRRLRELFLREIGLPAKRLARVARFRRALGQLAAEGALHRGHAGVHRPELARVDGVDLAGIAAACGYYDQSHLYRDFRELSGMTPHAYLRALGAGLDGPDVVGG